jgi:hypothetical protein
MQIFYGHLIPGSTQRKPFVVLPRRVDESMLHFFRDMEFFQLDLRKLSDDSTGFVANVDHPDVPNHHYWEGCFHGRLDEEHVIPNIFHPRHQRAFDMPAAPLELRAFMEVLRQKAMSEWYNPNVRPRLLSLINDHPELKQGVETLIEI